MAGVTTRHQSGSKLSEYLGKGKALHVSELPTLRDVLRYGLYPQERNYPLGSLMKDIHSEISKLWTNANASFVYPVILHEATILSYLKENWELAGMVARGKATSKKRQELEKKLDKLFDLLSCKCILQTCIEVGCSSDCLKEVHLMCTCPKSQKIPTNELKYVQNQRSKSGTISSYQLGPPDLHYTKKVLRNEDRKNRDIQKLQDSKEIEENEHAEQTEHSDEDFDSSKETEMMPQQLADTPEISSKKRNYADISNIALTSIRYGTGLRETAAIATAAWIDAGIISKDYTRLIIDHSKVRRAQEQVMKEICQKSKSLGCEKATCIFFDGRKDLTKTLLKHEGSTRVFPATIKEEHYTVCTEPGGKYLFHFVPEEATKEKKHAEIIADNIVQHLEEQDLSDSLMAVGGDSTNVNTGWAGGAIQYIETKLGRKLTWLVCALHTNELQLRALIGSLDGKTLSNNKWSGPIGKLLDDATTLEVNPCFQRIDIGEPLIKLEENVIQGLSGDQYYGYKIVEAIKEGILPKDLMYLEIGPVNHSRWLTTALRLCRIWVSNHGLRGELLKNLQFMVEFIVGVYMPMWFKIKVAHKFTNGPRHVLDQLKLLRYQSQDVKEIVMPTVQCSAWFAFSEEIIQAMLCSESKEERVLGVDHIIAIRGSGEEATQVGDNSVRVRRTPIINDAAECLEDLIDWSEAYEPVLTCHITTEKLKDFIETPMEVPDWPCHGQSIERKVKQVTEASMKVFTHEKREGYIKSQEFSRELMSKTNSKQDLENLVNYKCN